MGQLVHRSDEAEGTPPSRPQSIPSARFSRYTLVSLSAAGANALIYRVLLATLASAALANIGAATMVIVPTYLVHRRWTWRIRSPEAKYRSAVLYWSFSMVNVSVSTTLAWWLDRRGVSDRSLIAATAAIYATTWLLRFALLDRVLFRRFHQRGPGHQPPAWLRDR